MPVFKLKKDEKVEAWWREYYEIESDTIEEAVQAILDGDIDPYDSKFMPEFGIDPLQVIIEDYNENILYDSEQL